MKGPFFFKGTTFVYVLSSDWLNYWFDTYNTKITQLIHVHVKVRSQEPRVLNSKDCLIKEFKVASLAGWILVFIFKIYFISLSVRIVSYIVF